MLVNTYIKFSQQILHRASRSFLISQRRHINVGIVGAGTISREFAQEFLDAGATVTAVCDVNKTNAEKFSSDFDGRPTAVEGDVRALLSADVGAAIDLIYVGSPPAHHCDAVLASLDAGKHVLCEKPMAMNDTETALMCAAARQRRETQVTAINFPLRNVEALQEMKRLLNEGYVGDLRRIDIQLHIPVWPRVWQAAWAGWAEQGGCLREIGSHLLYALHVLAGTPRAVRRVVATTAFDENPSDARNAEVEAKAIFELHNDTDLTRHRSQPVLVGVDMMANVPLQAEQLCLSAIGTAGRLELKDFTRLLGTQASGEALTDMLDTEGASASDEPVFMSSTPCAQDIVRAVRDAKQSGKAMSRYNLVPLEYGQQTQRLLGAVLNSHGNWLQIDDPILTVE